MAQRLFSLRLLATYNKAMNLQLLDCAAKLSHEELIVNRNAFFGSILGTFNHLAIGDTIWLKRFARQKPHDLYLKGMDQLEMPLALNQVLFADLESLFKRRTFLDDVICSWIDQLVEGDLEDILSYANTQGIDCKKTIFNVLLHLFNHQTHHRGQLSTLLSQAGVDVGVTDLIAYIPNQEA